MCISTLWGTTRLLLMGSLAYGISTSAQTPSFSTSTPESGMLGNSLVIVLPIANSGGASASLVRVTSATLGSSTLESPTLPLPLGAMAALVSRQLVLQFNGSRITLGKNYLLTVRGTYQVGAATLGFAVNRIIQIATPSSAVLTELQRWIALDAIRAEFASLPGVDRVADGQAMLSFLESRPEFIKSGISQDASSIWAQFADGQPIVIANDRQVSRATTTTFAKAESKLFTYSPLMNRALIRPAIERTTYRDTKFQRTSWRTVYHSQTSRPVPFVSPQPPTTAAPVDPKTELPLSSSFRMVNGLERPAYNDTQMIDDVTFWMKNKGYQPEEGADASVSSLKTVGGEGIFYFDTHGGLWGDGTAAFPHVYTIRTRTPSSFAEDLVVADDMVLPDPALIRMSARVELDPLYGWVVQVNYGITHNFIDKYWGDFSVNSFVYIDACHSDDNTGDYGPAVATFMHSIFSKKASVYAGWSGTVPDSFAIDTAKLVFDRLLGANEFCAETDPESITDCEDGPAEPPVFPQRPFDYQSVATVEFTNHSNVGIVRTVLDSFLVTLNFTPGASSSFGLLAPSISNMYVNEFSGSGGQLTINGSFGADPRPDGSVTIGGPNSTANIVSWAPDHIVADLNLSGAGSSGDVQVTVRGHQSNVARLTEWRGKNFISTVAGNGSLKLTTTFDLHLRGDLRKFRDQIHVPPREPLGSIAEAVDSSGTFSASGSGPGIGETVYWSGSGTLVPVSPSLPITGVVFFEASAGIVDSTHLKATVGAATEAFAPDGVCKQVFNGPPPTTSTTDLVIFGPSNFALLPAIWFFD